MRKYVNNAHELVSLTIVKDSSLFSFLTDNNYLTQPTEGFFRDLPPGTLIEFCEALSNAQITLTALKPYNHLREWVLLEEGSDGYDSKELTYILSLLGSKHAQDVQRFE